MQVQTHDAGSVFQDGRYVAASAADDENCSCRDSSIDVSRAVNGDLSEN